MTDKRVTGRHLSRPSVRTFLPKDEDRWCDLWSGYLEFYHAAVEPAVTAHLWRCMLWAEKPYIGLAAELGGELVGFAHVIVHPVTFVATDVACLEDLFVAPNVRNRGVASALVAHIIDLAANKGWSSVYWHTEAHNLTARRLYDRFTGVDQVVRYRITL